MRPCTRTMPPCTGHSEITLSQNSQHCCPLHAGKLCHTPAELAKGWRLYVCLVATPTRSNSAKCTCLSRLAAAVVTDYKELLCGPVGFKFGFCEYYKLDEILPNTHINNFRTNE